MARKTKILFDDTTVYGSALGNFLRNEKKFRLIKLPFNYVNISEIINQYAPNVIIIDTDYCYDTATKLVPIIKKNFPEIKVFSLTLWNMNILKQDMIDAGVDGHFSKINQFDNIIQLIKSHQSVTLS